MNRRNQILAALLIVQLIVGVLAVVLPAQAAQTQSRPLLEQLTDADVTALTIREQPDKEVRIARKDDQWVLPDVDDYPVDKTKVTELLSKLTGIQVSKPVLTTAGGHARLQVADDTFNRRVDLTTNKGERTLFFGPARGGSAHVRLAGSDDVFLTTRLAPFDIASDLTSWINTIYFTSTQQEVGKVTITNITGTLAFQRNLADGWEFKGLAAGEAFNPSRLETILSRVSSLYMTRPLGKIEKPEYGLSRPTAVLTLTLKSDVSGLQPLVLKIGARDDKDNTYVVKSSSSPWYVRVNGFIVEDIVNARREDFLQPPATPTPEATATPTP
ncbi:MAG: DUF4340 domain-containing protein [Anaerolineae bacterium]|jgi:hypothetical protein|nr:DUF4340 domain-containing protein [Anaerolineae bacterium]